jgi:hypothetical protein
VAQRRILLPTGEALIRPDAGPDTTKSAVFSEEHLRTRTQP